MTNVNRLKTFDLVKFFAIFLVIWGHVIQYLTSGVCYENVAYQIIYSFHMPLFMMIVGYFSIGSLKKTFKEFISRKSLQLILPGFVFGVIICGLMKYIHWNDILRTLVLDIWFLKSAFLCYLAFYISRYFGKFKKLYFVVILFLSQFVFIYQINLMFPCFIMGVILKYNWDAARGNTLKITTLTGGGISTHAVLLG